MVVRFSYPFLSWYILPHPFSAYPKLPHPALELDQVLAIGDPSIGNAAPNPIRIFCEPVSSVLSEWLAINDHPFL